MQRTVPITYYVYEFSYPEGMPELAGIIFYVGKGTSIQRLNNHLKEAADGCECRKCEAIRSIWDANLPVVRRIVFETVSEDDALQEEQRRILLHRSPFLTNIQHTIEARKPTAMRKRNVQTVALHTQTVVSERDAQISAFEHFDRQWEIYQQGRSNKRVFFHELRVFAVKMMYDYPSKRRFVPLWEEEKIKEYKEYLDS